MESKQCYTCKVTKPLSDFNKHSHSKGGYDYQCRLCHRARVNAINATPEGRLRKMVLDYAAREKRRERDKERLRMRRKLNGRPADNYKKSDREKCRKKFSNHRHYYGIPKPENCQECGSGYNIHAHHEDYTKPFNVEWLCSVCHGKRHRKYHATINEVLK